MKMFHNQSISIRLALCFTLLILMTSILGVSSIINTNKIKHFTEQVYTTAIVPALDNDSCIVTLYKIKDNLNTLLISTAPEKPNEYKTIIIKDQKVIQDSLDAFTSNNTLISNQNLLTEIASSADTLNQQIDLFINLLDQNNRVEATSLLNNTISPLIETLQSHYQRLNEEHNTSISKLITTDVNLSQQAVLLTVIILILAILISLFLILLINKTMTKPLKKLILVARQIAVGDLTNTYTIDGSDEIALLSTSLSDVSIHIKSLVVDADMLTKAAIEGRLDTRADASKHNGDFAKIVEGVNQTLDAVIGPLNVAAEYVDRISKGDIPPKITDHYNGDFNEIKNNLNLCIDTIKSLVADADMLSKAAIEGRLDTRADASKHSGDFAKIVEGVNQTLDAVIGPLNVAAEYVDRISKGDIPPKITDHYNGDFNEIKNNLNLCIDTVKSLVADTNILIQAAIEGRLDTRADASKHSGDFAKIIEGVNKTLDAVIKPLKEYTNVLNEMSTGNLQIRVVGNYNGDLAEVKYALNSTLDFLSGYVQEISNVLMEMAHSNMVITITNEYKGDFLKIKDALNLIIASLNQVLGEVNTTADEVAFSARQVSNSSTSLAEGSTKQATSIDSLTSSITQIATQTKQNATASNDVKDISLTTRTNALKGNKEMDKMLTAMVDINETCNNIFKIIKVIDDIAFQTNILALNASVEAARAGQQGKGFAVVAEEVRNLASKAASAAKETALLIEKCMDSVKVGTNIANTTAESLNHIVEGIEKVTHLVSLIATSSSEQQLSVEQINQNIYTISSVVQTTSATAEETAAASEQLSNQAELLKQQILKFKLKN